MTLINAVEVTRHGMRRKELSNNTFSLGGDTKQIKFPN